jgi:hypothetical protein
LLTIAGSADAWSVDAGRNGSRDDVAAWPVVLMKCQVTIVYLSSAAAKLTPLYLAGEVLRQSIKPEALWLVPAAWRSPSFWSAMAYASILVELFIALALWSGRVRVAAWIVGAGFHLLLLTSVDSSRLSLLIFALDLIPAYVLFVDYRGEETRGIERGMRSTERTADA